MTYTSRCTSPSLLVLTQLLQNTRKPLPQQNFIWQNKPGAVRITQGKEDLKTIPSRRKYSCSALNTNWADKKIYSAEAYYASLFTVEIWNGVQCTTKSYFQRLNGLKKQDVGHFVSGWITAVQWAASYLEAKSGYRPSDSPCFAPA